MHVPERRPIIKMLPTGRPTPNYKWNAPTEMHVPEIRLIIKKPPNR